VFESWCGSDDNDEVSGVFQCYTSKIYKGDIAAAFAPSTV
jgi:hypothetical protein